MKKVIGLLVLSWIGITGSAFAQDSQNSQTKQLQEAMEQVTWKNLSIDFFEVKEKSESGYKSMLVKSSDDKNGKTFYVSKQPILSLSHTQSIDVAYNPNDDDRLRLIVRFNQEGKQILDEYSKTHRNEMMGVVIDGKLRLVATLVQPLTNGRVQVYGFEPDEAVSILKRYYQPKLRALYKLRAAQSMSAPAKTQ